MARAREAATASFAFLFVIQAADGIAFVIFVASDAETAALTVAASVEPMQPKRQIRWAAIGWHEAVRKATTA
jgi:hypothetical protein